MSVLSGIVALNWLLVYTLASSLAVNAALQLAAAAVYVCHFAPRHVCPLLLQQPMHAQYLRRTWGAANSLVNTFSQARRSPVCPCLCAPMMSVLQGCQAAQPHALPASAALVVTHRPHTRTASCCACR